MTGMKTDPVSDSLAGGSQGSVCVEGEGLAGGQRGWGKCLYISWAGPCGGDGIGVSGEAAGRKACTQRDVLVHLFANKHVLALNVL